MSQVQGTDPEGLFCKSRVVSQKAVRVYVLGPRRSSQQTCSLTPWTSAPASGLPLSCSGGFLGAQACRALDPCLLFLLCASAAQSLLPHVALTAQRFLRGWRQVRELTVQFFKSFYYGKLQMYTTVERIIQ